MKGLSNRIAVVTGATGLLGTAISQRLVAEGVRVVVTSRRKSKAEDWAVKLTSDAADSIIPVELNLLSEPSIRSAFHWIFKNVGIPTIFIANASLRDGLATPFTEITHGHFGRLFESDVAGHFLCARTLVDRLRSDMSASIVFISSIYAQAGVDHSIYPAGMIPTPLQYASVKAGMLGATRYLAALWGSHGVRVNAVIPGGIRSSIKQPEEFVQNYSRKTMLGRMGLPEEIADSIAFLASDESSYITGQFLMVDGGFSAW